MRVLIDYRPALKEPSGVGEYTHRLIKALLQRQAANGSGGLELTVFSSSWKDRLHASPFAAELAGATLVDRRVPVRVLNFAWHRLGWPAAESLAGGSFDVAHSPHPLLLPAHDAAQVVTIHDLNFLAHPEGTGAEVRRDYCALARDHALRADRVIVPSRYTAREVEQRLGVQHDLISVCPPGSPDWPPRARSPRDGYVLFVGTLEPRKNVGALLDAYERLTARAGIAVPELVLAGGATDRSREWLDRIGQPPLEKIVRYAGYVDPARLRELYEGARLLVQPSFDEGFGIPVLEAMTLGVPVIASSRGAHGEVLGGAGLLVDPDRPGDLAEAIVRMLGDDEFAAGCARRGAARSRDFRWAEAAQCVYDAYQQAVEHRRRIGLRRR